MYISHFPWTHFEFSGNIFRILNIFLIHDEFSRRNFNFLEEYAPVFLERIVSVFVSLCVQDPGLSTLGTMFLILTSPEYDAGDEIVKAGLQRVKVRTWVI